MVEGIVGARMVCVNPRTKSWCRAASNRELEQVIETVASGAGNSVGWTAETGVLFVVFAVIWVGFGAALVTSQGSLDQAWQWVRSLPLLVQIVTSSGSPAGTC